MLRVAVEGLEAEALQDERVVVRPLRAMVLQVGERVRHPLVNAVKERDGHLLRAGLKGARRVSRA